jgi:uncharacterized protein (TIGR02145 family)
MLIKYLPVSLIILTLCCLNPCIAQLPPPISATFIGGGGDNNFSNPTNWSPAGVPVSGLEIIISAGATLVVDMDYTCTRLTLNTGSTFSCTGGHTLTIINAIIDENGKVRIQVGSSLVIGSGIQVPVLAQTSGTFIDARDGLDYNWVKIGSQIWMAENLAFNNDGGCWAYNNDEGNVATYGRLYNWGTALAVCPSGWHLPSDAEWTTLTDFLGGGSVAGGKLKETGTTHWSNPNVDATNETGFTALPGGSRNRDGNFNDLANVGNWWSATEHPSIDGNAWHRIMVNSVPNIYRSWYYKEGGFSVRCVKD